MDEKLVFGDADKVIAVSNELKRDLETWYRIPADKIVVVPNGINVDKFKPMDAKAVKAMSNKMGIKNEKVIMSSGRLRKPKGFHLLIKSFPELLKRQKLKLIIIGTGPFLQRLKKMSYHYGIEKDVIFLGSVPHEDMPIYYNLADIFVFPTLTREGFPLVVAEAMACRKPVIASRIGGIPTAIENYKDGILIEPGNLGELEEKILEVLSNESLSKKLGENARKKVLEKFSLDRMVDDTIKVYEEVTK
jgi:glycosyltransferase involved in cell wall biosynthesis